MECMGPEKFLERYELELDKEFESDGTPAGWANDTAHRFFGHENTSIALTSGDPNRDEGGDDDDAQATVSSDGRYIAISTNAVIRIYHIKTQELRAELVGHQGNVSQLHFAPTTNNAVPSSEIKQDTKENKAMSYRLVSSSEEGRRGNDHIIAWALDDKGRQLERTMPFAVQGMADRAINSIASDLAGHHSLSEADIDAVRTAFAQALQVADTKNRLKHLPLFKGEFAHFGTYPFSPDGGSFFYTASGRSTQQGARPPDKLPQIVVVDLATQTERCRLKGHRDAIMWAGWSPDGTTIATACWDKYYKIWDAHTGECRHTIGPTGCQNWAGAFSPDGKHVLLCGGQEAKKAVYNVETGEEVAELKSEGLKFHDWVRFVAWSEDCIALVNHLEIILWYPFMHKVEIILKLSSDKSMLKRYNNFEMIKWVQGGKKLLLQDMARNTYVWDREKNVKWRFERPKGMAMDLYTNAVFYVEEEDMVLSLDGDRKVRFWKL